MTHPKLILSLVFLAACSPKRPISIAQTDNAEFKVERLFTHEGCHVYRFTDEHRSHYFTNCTEAIGTRLENCGKNCWHQIDERIGGK